MYTHEVVRLKTEGEELCEQLTCCFHLDPGNSKSAYPSSPDSFRSLPRFETSGPVGTITPSGWQHTVCVIFHCVVNCTRVLCCFWVVVSPTQSSEGLINCMHGIYIFYSCGKTDVVRESNQKSLVIKYLEVSQLAIFLVNGLFQKKCVRHEVVLWD